MGGGRADRAGDAAKQASPRVGGGKHQMHGEAADQNPSAQRLTNAQVPAHHKGDGRLHVRREAAGECRRLTRALQRRQFCITPVACTRRARSGGRHKRSFSD